MLADDGSAPPEDAAIDLNRFQLVVPSRAHRQPLHRRTNSLTTHAVPVDDPRDAAASDWYETVVAGNHRITRWHSATPTRAITPLQGSLSHELLVADVRPMPAELVLADEVRINPDIMERATTPIRVGKFVFSRHGPAPEGDA
jgi:hypothetical protein